MKTHFSLLFVLGMIVCFTITAQNTTPILQLYYNIM